MDYTHHMHISHTIHNILQNKLCIETISIGVVNLATTSKALRQGEAGGPASRIAGGDRRGSARRFLENADQICIPVMDFFIG
jgi:methyl coenzyme M reductase beta subunit